MNLAVLRVEGDETALANLRRALGLEADDFNAWAAGETTMLGHVRDQSGFSTTIADEPTPGELVAEVREFLHFCEEEGIHVDPARLSAELDIGVTVGASKQFTASVRFTAEELIALGRLGIELRVSAYPTSDDWDDDRDEDERTTAGSE